jgi:hypothetical protein
MPDQVVAWGGALKTLWEQSACPVGLLPTRTFGPQIDLRPSVIHRKVTGGSRFQLGTDVSALLTSLQTTARKRCDNLFQALRAVAAPSPLHADGAAS